jgi:hypothetical protein
VAGDRRRKKTPQIIAHIEELLRDEVAGDPMSGLRWTRKTTSAEQLLRLGIEVSANTVARLLSQMGFSLKTNRKNIESGSVARRICLLNLPPFLALGRQRPLPPLASCRRRWELVTGDAGPSKRKASIVFALLIGTAGEYHTHRDLWHRRHDGQPRHKATAR